jgi:hypothetical protein
MTIPTVDAASSHALASTSIAQTPPPVRTGGAGLPQDVVSIGTHSRSAAGVAESNGQAALGGSADQERGNAGIRRQQHYPGQKGYVPPPLSTQFDHTGQLIRTGDQGARVDISV